MRRALQNAITDDDVRRFQRNLPIYLAEARLTQRELANKLGVTQASVSGLCRGARPMNRMHMLAIKYALGMEE